MVVLSDGPEVVDLMVVVVVPVGYFETSVVSSPALVVVTLIGTVVSSVMLVDLVVTGLSPVVVPEEMVVTMQI